ncbi:hydantoin utilization protein [Bdellovibrio bacteriovorus]
MQNRFVLGVSVGESFAEYSLLSGEEALAQKRVYLSRENLKTSLTQFLAEQKQKPEHVFVSLRLPKKLLDYRFGGAVAHLTTEGFENWLDVCGTKHAALTNKDLIFSINERVLANGTIEAPLKIEDLEAISAKLSLVDCKKICLHFLHSNKNPSHLMQAQQFFTEKGLEVFVPDNADGAETERWNKNALNATMSSLFEERKKEVLEACEGIPAEKIYFLSSSGKLINSKNEALESLFAATTAMGMVLGADKNTDVLYLGLENFWLISGQQWKESWNSAWGDVALKHLQFDELGIQPTLGISLNSFNRFDFNTTQEGWEPGPMFLGRGQKSCLLDLWAENTKLAKTAGLEDRLVPQGITRFKNSLFALSKISKIRDNEVTTITKELQSLSMHRLAMESYLKRKSKKLLVTGPLANVFANVFKKDAQTSVDVKDFAESTATAVFGMKTLEASL